MSDLDVRVAALGLFPVKSCGGLAPREALLIETGLELDRHWMVVDPQGRMRTQREWPRLALVRPTLRLSDLLLRAPGMLALHLTLDAAEGPLQVQVWNDTLEAYDMGDLAAQWFSDFLGAPCRLARLDPDAPRTCDPRWAGDSGAVTGFADGFSLLVTSTASLAELNRRLAEDGRPPVTMDRFRPNLVLDGGEAFRPFDEDHVETLHIDTDDGPIGLRLVKPCVRCGIPNVDPANGEAGDEPGRTLARFRTDARMGGGITFGMNAIVTEGVDRMLRVGQRGRARLAF